ncbi:IS66 family insertion sequence element accessory protein TnpB [Rhodopirellula sp. P2]|uniref:IS66 family insertion sequence element accessory protein TnpB n=1 Tax=Rhodopirellula sp. P2 TaxID=2127060 RepID=UPI003FD0F0C7
MQGNRRPKLLSTQVDLCAQPIDFRKGFDGLTGIVTNTLGQRVNDGSLFLFANRKRDRIKALWCPVQ